MSNKNSQKVAVQAAEHRPEPGDEAYTPLVDVYEEADGTTVLVAEVPGAAAESVDIRVDQGVLTVTADGTAPAVDERYARTYTGFVTGEYFRAFALSDEVDRDAISARLEDGLLTLRLPRAAAAKTRKIEITDEG